ncbi:hypothetical protein [Gordonia malaquae]|uniref:hypothetical protein n=1 Tax=Gordonia malaquae TaxID=410332 RepID=UPI00301AD179
MTGHDDLARLRRERDEARAVAEWNAKERDYLIKQAEAFGIGEFRTTTHAYELAVAALDEHRARADRAEAAVARVQALVEHWEGLTAVNVPLFLVVEALAGAGGATQSSEHS